MTTKNEEEPPAISSVDTSSTATSAAAAAASTFPNWLDLPEDLLLLILDRLSFSIPDLLSFALVCRPWFSLAASASATFSGPPLRLIPSTSSQMSWSAAPECRLETLPPTRRSYRSMICSEILYECCVGYSHCKMIFVYRVRDGATVADVFTGREICSPDFPDGCCCFSSGILTAPPSSPSCSLLLVCKNFSVDVFDHSRSFSILCWRIGSSDNKWSEIQLNDTQEIVSLLVFKGQIFVLNLHYELLVVEFFPSRTWKKLRVPELSTSSFRFDFGGKFGQYLVECEEELLLVLFLPAVTLLPDWVGPLTIEVYQLNLSVPMWVKKEGLGDWCLFIDPVGRCPFACPNPARWGGRNNCIYMAGPGCDTWGVYPVDGKPVDTITAGSPLHSSNVNLSKWPSPIWVCPNICINKAKQNLGNEMFQNKGKCFQKETNNGTKCSTSRLLKKH